MRKWLLEGVEFDHIPPPISHAKNIPIILYECLSLIIYWNINILNHGKPYLTGLRLDTEDENVCSPSYRHTCKNNSSSVIQVAGIHYLGTYRSVRQGARRSLRQQYQDLDLSHHSGRPVQEPQ